METVTLKQNPHFFYLRIQMDIYKDKGLPYIRLDALGFKRLLDTGLGSLHGQVGAAINVDVLSFDAKSLEAILKVEQRGLVRVWSALTLLSSFQGRQCAIRVNQVMLTEFT
ncbi:PREDICTED: ribonuclease P protein subunit p14-like isoform X1 [Acropora digitifera]|uniref:ribonuclease P protein subunit p14-like isoform X1 n=1 Tax=Acropora digitifera TaxID=70779 RepID=UPI00077AB26E|nr:PREDICTED: ribonuclease P protein subunit p14-like isoform X1 [Acropora digitifera]